MKTRYVGVGLVFMLGVLLQLPVSGGSTSCSSSSGYDDNIEGGSDIGWFDDWWDNNFPGGDDDDIWDVGDDPFGFDDDDWDEWSDDDDDWWDDLFGDDDDDDGDDDDWWDDLFGDDDDTDEGEGGDEDESLEDKAKKAEELAEEAKKDLAEKNEDLDDAEKDLLNKKRFLDEWTKLMADPEFDDRPQEEKDAITQNILRLQNELDQKDAELKDAQAKQAEAAAAEKEAAEATANLQKLLAEKKEAERKAAEEAARIAEEKAKQAAAEEKARLEREAEQKRQEAERLRQEAEEAARQAEIERKKAELAAKVEDDYSQDSGETPDRDKTNERITDMGVDMDQPTSYFGLANREATAEEVHGKVMENLTRISGSDASTSSNLAISQADKYQKGEYAKANLKDIAAGVITATLDCGLAKMTGPVGGKLKEAIETVIDNVNTVKDYYENAQEVYNSISNSLRDQGLEVHQETFQGYNYTLNTTTVFDPKTHEYTTYVSRIPTGNQGTMSRALLDCSQEEFNQAMAGNTSSAVISGTINYE